MKLNDLLLSLDKYSFKHKIQTRWIDMDLLGHINNATYLTYIEDSRLSFFERWNIKHPNKSIIVAAIQINYINQIKHPSKLIVGSKISHIGNSSFDIISGIFVNKSNKPSATSLVTCVCYDFNNNNPVPVYNKIKKDYLI